MNTFGFLNKVEFVYINPPFVCTVPAAESFKKTPENYNKKAKRFCKRAELYHKRAEGLKKTIIQFRQWKTKLEGTFILHSLLKKQEDFLGP